MKYTIILLFITMIATNSCNSNQEKNGEATETKTEATTVDPAKDSAAIRAVILDFYNWYDKNYQKLMGYQLYSSLKKKDAAPYKMNWDQVDQYQTFIRDSVPQLGDEFLKNQKIMFTKADSAFKVDIDGDVPYYFDYDWYTNSQEEPKYLLDGINKSTKWIITLKGDDAKVEIGAPGDKNYVTGSLLLQVDMKKENGQWTIAKIGND